MTVLGLDVAERPLEIRARIGYMPESDAHIPGMNAVSFVAYCGQLAGLPRGRRDAARARGALLRRPRRGALPQRRDLLDRHEAAHQAGAGARARSRSAVPRRADQRHGPEGPRRDARAHPRPRAQQGRQPDPLVAPAARRRVHLRPRRRHGQGRDRGVRADRRAQRAARPRLRAARQGRPARAFVARAAGRRPRVPRDRRGRHARVRAGRRAARRRRPASHLRARARAGVQVRHLRPSVPTLEDVFAQAVGEE